MSITGGMGTSRVVKVVRDFLAERVAEPGVVAVSGGADSVALLRALAAGGFAITVAHLNHQLRGDESDADEAFVRDLSTTLGVGFRSARIDVAKETFWAKDDEHKEEIIAGLKGRKHDITRFKGLGEMPFRVLSQTTLDPKSRKLLKVEISENIDAHNTFKDLLGKDAEPRYEFIMQKAGLANLEELDV